VRGARGAGGDGVRHCAAHGRPGRPWRSSPGTGRCRLFLVPGVAMRKRPHAARRPRRRSVVSADVPAPLLAPHGYLLHHVGPGVWAVLMCSRGVYERGSPGMLWGGALGGAAVQEIGWHALADLVAAKAEGAPPVASRAVSGTRMYLVHPFIRWGSSAAYQNAVHTRLLPAPTGACLPQMLLHTRAASIREPGACLFAFLGPFAIRCRAVVCKNLQS